jgi:hypothetical protein
VVTLEHGRQLAFEGGGHKHARTTKGSGLGGAAALPKARDVDLLDSSITSEDKAIRPATQAVDEIVVGKRHRRAQPEAQLQRSLVEHLKWCARTDVWWTHIPNGGWRSRVEAAIFKAMGVQAGAPDLFLIRAGQPLFLELKAPGRKLSPTQIECHAALRRAGATVETFDNIDAALAFLRRLGVLR